MGSNGTFLEQFDAIELTVDPTMPDMPWHLLLLAKAVQLALGNLRKKYRMMVKQMVLE